MRLPILTVILGILILSPAAFGMENASKIQQNCEFFRDILIPNDFKPGIAFLGLDRHIFATTKGDLSNLRLLDSEGIIKPYALRKGRVAKGMRALTSDVLNLTHDSENRIFMEFDIGQTVITHNHITLYTKRSNFMRKVTVEGSHNRNDWKILRDNALIFYFPGEPDRKNLEISYPRSSYRYVRVTIGGGEEPVALAGAELQHETKAYDRLIPVEHQGIKESKPINDSQETRYVIDIGDSGIPFEKIEFQSDDQNFFLHVQVLSGEDEANLKELGSGDFFRYKKDDAEAENMAISFQESSQRFLALDITNLDNQSFSIKSVIISGVMHYFYFDVSENESIRLFYGGHKLKTPEYNFEQIHRNLRPSPNRELQLSEVIKNPIYQTDGFELSAFLQTYLLRIIFGVAAVLLLWSSIKTFKSKKSKVD